MKRRTRALAVLLAVAGAAAGAVRLTPPVRAESLRVFAAASLTESFQEIAALLREQSPGTSVEFSFGGSQVLRTQIEHGARADLFASADQLQIEALQPQGLVGPDSVFARNRLVVVTPSDEPRVRNLADLERPGIRIVIADPSVPAGRYTREVLERMGRAGPRGEDLPGRITANVVSQETNVRAVLAKVLLDEVDAGFVYSTDALTAGGKVKVLEIPDSLNAVAEYSIAVVAKGPCPACAARFLALLHGEPGQAVLRRHGFAPAR